MSDCKSNCNSCKTRGTEKKQKPCDQCGGKGSYKIFNAYSNDETTVVCEYCGGSGVLNPNILRLNLDQLLTSSLFDATEIEC